MSSEAITRNDLSAILNAVIHGKPNEYKKLLWTNTQGGQTSYSITANFSNYDVIEVEFDRVGCIYSFTMANSGSATFRFPYEGYFVTRTATILGSTMTIGNGGYYGTYNNGTVTNGASYAVPSKVYGIKYERVAPPQVNASDYVIEQDTSGIWTYRKWDSGRYEAWAFVSASLSSYVTVGSWYGYYTDITLPAFMLTKENLFVNCPLASDTQFCMPSGYIVGSNSLRLYAVSAGSGTQTIMFNLLMIGTWK